MVEYEPLLSLRDSIKKGRENVEKDEVDNAINVYRKAVFEFLWIVRSIKTVDNLTVIDNIFMFCKSLGIILRNLYDLESITSMQKLQYHYMI